MREVIISENDAGQRLDKFMSKKFKTMPPSLLYKYLRLKCVRINGKKTSQKDAVLKKGDVLSFYISEDVYKRQVFRIAKSFMKNSKSRQGYILSEKRIPCLRDRTS